MQQPLLKSGLLAGFLGICLFSTGLQADSLNNAQNTIQNSEAAAKRTQAQVDRLDDQAQGLFHEYRQVAAEAEQLALYNQQMMEIIGNQESELASIARQIVEIEHTERGVLPLMSRMLGSLEQFVELDTPFLLQERRTRIALLKDLLVRSDVSISEKFRRILEAYEVEVEYGRTLETYRARQDDITYEFLRVGRVALYRMNKEGDQAWVWHSKKQWLEVASGDLRELRKAYKVAQQTAAPDLLTLPMPTLTSLQGGK